MAFMVVTLDTSHLDMSPVNSFALGIRLSFASKNNQLISLTAETSQDPIGPRGPWEQSEDSCKHSLMAVWSSALDFGAHPVVEHYNRGYPVRLRVMIRIMIRFRVRARVRVYG